MLARAAVLLAVARGVAAQCTIAGMADPTNGELETSCTNGAAIAVGDTTTCRYSCNFGYTDTGAQASCTGTSTWSAGSPACQGASPGSSAQRASLLRLRPAPATLGPLLLTGLPLACVQPTCATRSIWTARATWAAACRQRAARGTTSTTLA
jgi:hypothetical protein